MNDDGLKKGKMIWAQIKIVEAATQAAVGGRDLMGDISQIAFGPHLHLCLEQGIKWLARQETGLKHPNEQSHNIKPVYDALSDEHKNRLKTAFDDAMQFYGYAYLEKDGLGAYLQKHGSQSNFNQMRYFLLPGESGEMLNGIVFGIHIRLIEEIHRLLIGASFRSLDSTIGLTIEAALSTTWWRSSSDTERESAVRRARVLLQEGAKPVASVLRNAVQQRLGDTNVKSLLCELVKKLKEGQADNPTYAMIHYLCTLEYRLPGLEPSVDVRPSVECPREGAAFVHSPAGEWLGLIERRHDGTWLADPVGDSNIYVDFDDAVSYLVNKRTVVLLINGQAKRVMDSNTDAGFQLYGGAWRKNATMELEFWDESHGLSSGGNLSVVQEDRIMVRRVDGKVARVDGRKVSVLVQNDYWGVP